MPIIDKDVKNKTGNHTEKINGILLLIPRILKN